MWLTVRLSKEIYVPWGIASLCFLVHMALFWPGLLSPDSYSQLGQAQAKVFSNHHPILMSLIWSWFNQLVPGSGLMFALHLILLWGSIGLFAYTLSKHKVRSWWWFYFIPLWPVCLCYSSMVWKDVSFAFSFLAAISILFHCTFLNKKPTLFQAIIIIMLLGYGVGVKYQALYVLPFCIFWLSYLFFNQKLSKSSMLLTLSISIGIWGANTIIDRSFVPLAQQSNAWQMARLYDLAGISTQENRPIFPTYILKNPYFSMEKLKKFYSFQNIDALMYNQPPTLISTSDPKDLACLWDTWKQAVVKHPLSYTRHRMGVWLKLLNKNITDYNYYLTNDAKNLFLASFTVPFLKTYLSFFPSLLLRFYWVIPIFFLSIYVSRKKYIDSNIKFVYRMLTTISCVQLIIYFFLSMASDLRYLLLSNLIAFFLIPLIDISKKEKLNEI